MDKISIIVPVYNNEKFLEKCLDSIINQTYKNIEIILINDGSTDNSLNIIKKYIRKDSRIILIDKKNEGVSKARNDGIKRSSGKYVSFVDSDDYLELNAIEKLYKSLISNRVDVVRSNYQVYYEDKSKLNKGDLTGIDNKKYNSKSIRSEIIPKILSGFIPCFACLLLIKKELLSKTNLFPVDIHMMEDVVFYLDLLTKTNSLYILDDITYNIYFNENGSTNNKKNYEKNIFNILKVNKYLKKILEKELLDSSENLIILNTANCEAISDFIFKLYLYGNDVIEVCKKISNDDIFKDIFNNIDTKKINFQRKIILKLVIEKKFRTLICFFKFRQQIRKLKG